METKFLTVCLFDFNNRKLYSEALGACKVTGINPEDLYEKQLSQFYPYGQNENAEEIAQMRYQNYEKRRTNKMKILVEFLREKGENVKSINQNFVNAISTPISKFIKNIAPRPKSAHPNQTSRI